MHRNSVYKTNISQSWKPAAVNIPALRWSTWTYIFIYIFLLRVYFYIFFCFWTWMFHLCVHCCLAPLLLEQWELVLCGINRGYVTSSNDVITELNCSIATVCFAIFVLWIHFMTSDVISLIKTKKYLSWATYMTEGWDSVSVPPLRHLAHAYFLHLLWWQNK